MCHSPPHRMRRKCRNSRERHSLPHKGAAEPQRHSNWGRYAFCPKRWAVHLTFFDSSPLGIRQERWYALVEWLGENKTLLPKSPPKSDLLQGTLDVLVLKTLALEPMHGWGISQRIQQVSEGVLSVTQGSLYPALHRLERQGWIQSRWSASENNRQAKFYELTKRGHQRLAEETEGWERFSAAMGRVLGAQS
jgi:PadR family transcriptional regulator PadR